MVEYTSTYTKYDYSLCNHPELQELNRIVNSCKARIKQIETELRSVPVEGESKTVLELPKLVYETASEVVDVYPPSKKQTMGAKIFV